MGVGFFQGFFAERAASRRALRLMGLMGFVVAFSFMSSCQQPLSFNAVDITGADYAKDLNWRDRSGLEHHLSDFKGQVVLVFFGYTQCPDVCPTSLSELKDIKMNLGPEGNKVHTLFVTVDPERDTQEVLDAYMANFGEDFLGISLSPEQLKLTAKDYKIFYQKVSGKDPKYYTIDHTAGSYAIDKKGQLRLFIKHNQGEKNLADDLKKLVRAN